mgnify:CR=1 FL=1
MAFLSNYSNFYKNYEIISVNNKFILRTGNISKNTRGTHTTRHCEIVNVTENTKIVDTPGFSNLKFDFLMPAEVGDLFDEIAIFKNKCKFKDCTHTGEIGCSVLENIKTIAKSRYDSYLEFLEEAKEFKTRIKNQGFKKEVLHKENLDKKFVY